jgi:hypothetical protein
MITMWENIVIEGDFSASVIQVYEKEGFGGQFIQR